MNFRSGNLKQSKTAIIYTEMEDMLNGNDGYTPRLIGLIHKTGTENRFSNCVEKMVTNNKE